jgi:hypothetical protein
MTIKFDFTQIILNFCQVEIYAAAGLEHVDVSSETSLN